MASPRPKPTVLKMIAGNPGRRRLNEHEPLPAAVESIACPEHVTGSARVMWDRLAPILDDMGVLTVADLIGLERICACHAEMMVAQESIDRDGMTYSSGERIYPNPAVAQLRTAEAMFHRYLLEFGLTPAARSKVKANAKRQEKDTAERHFD